MNIEVKNDAGLQNRISQLQSDAGLETQIDARVSDVKDRILEEYKDDKITIPMVFGSVDKAPAVNVKICFFVIIFPI